MTEKLASKLQKFDRFTKILDQHSNKLESCSKEVGVALVEMFVAILDFWTMAVVNLRGSSRGTCDLLIQSSGVDLDRTLRPKGSLAIVR
jgi:hypothetical protein